MFEKFNQQFPSEDACLEYLRRKKWPRKKLYRIKGRKAYADTKGNHYFPLKGTIFEGSRTPLMKWFYALYLVSVSKNGVSAGELKRHLGVTEKCAWRIGKQIRSIMKEEGPKLCGVVEADETYVGKRRTGTQMCIIGAVERGGRARVKVTRNRREETVIPFLEHQVRKGTRLMTDDAGVYKTTRNYKHRSVNHSKFKWVRGEVHTNTIEGFWSQFKRSLKGTYHCVSPRHLQSYCDQFAFYRNYRGQVLEALLARV